MRAMEISEHTIHYLQTDEEGWNFYTRYSADSWSVKIGESDEPVYDSGKIIELESLFREWSSKNII